MSFLKALFSVFSGDKKEEAQENPIALPEDVSRKLEEERLKYYPLATQKTLDLVEGIPDDVRKTLYERITSEASPFTRGDAKGMTEELFPLVEKFDWKWKEWEFWRPICIKRKTYTNGMRCFCFPWADELDLELERTEYEPAKVFNVMTLKVAKERLTAFPETSSMKKAELIEFLNNNEKAWNAVIDPHIQAKWDRKKHYEGPTPKMVFELMLWTIQSRAHYLNDLNRIQSASGTAKERFTFSYDEELFAYAKRIKSNPWKENFGPSIPGLDFYLEPKFPKNR